jgi:hypothetical protein
VNGRERPEEQALSLWSTKRRLRESERSARINTQMDEHVSADPEIAARRVSASATGLLRR